MSKSMHNSPEDLEDRLLADWVNGLPDPPPDLVNATLHDLRHGTSTRPAVVRSPQRWRWFLLAGMTACVGLVIAGLFAFIMSSNDTGQTVNSPTAVSNLVQPPTVTASENSTFTPTGAASPVTTAGNTLPGPTSAGPTASPVSPTGLPQTAVSPATSPLSATGKVVETPSPVPANPPTASASLPAPSAQPELPTVRPVLPTFTARPTRPTETTSPASTPVATVPPTTTRAQATPIVGVITIPASTSPAATPQTFSGQISAINAGSLTLSNLTNPFILTSATRVKVNGQASTAAALQVGDNVVIQAAFNAQGELVALEISTSVKVQPKPISSPVK